jgi:hypothetical protein
MTINKLAQQIKDSVEKRVAVLGEMQRDEIEADVKKTAYLQIRCYELWAKDGCNDAIDVAAYMNQAEEETIYPTRKGLFYRIDGTINKTEALGFLKDWSTSLVQLDTGAIAAIGLFVRYTDFAHSPIHGIADLRDGARYLAIVEVISIALSALSFFLSLVEAERVDFLRRGQPGCPLQCLPGNRPARHAVVLRLQLHRERKGHRAQLCCRRQRRSARGRPQL